MTIIGPEEMVYDFSADRCDDGARPDLPPRVYRTIDGNLNLTMADPANFRMVGQDFDSLVPICPLIRDSAYNPDPANYAHFEWLASTYTEDGSTIHAVIHNEFHGDEAAGWLSRADFSLEQGDRDWSYLGRSGGTLEELPATDIEWRKGDLCLIAIWGMHPDKSCSPVRRWTAPNDGAVTISVDVADVGQGGGNGIVAGVDAAGETLWEVTIEEGDTTTYSEQLQIDFAAGDAIDFWVDSRGDAGFDGTQFDIVIDYGDGYCTGAGFACQQISLTYAVSEDGGATWTAAPSPDHLVATVPEVYRPDAGLAAMWQPSDIVNHPTDGFYYMFVQYDYHRGIDLQYECLLRTTTLDDPSSWRAWDGTAFEMSLPDPYTNPDIDPVDHTCANVVDAPIGGLTYNTYLETFVAIAAYGRIDPIGVYLLTSDDLINWSEPQLIIEAGWGWTQDGRLPYDAYPTLIDHSSESLSFDTTGKFPHLYIVRINSLDPIRDYDLVRFPLELSR